MIVIKFSVYNQRLRRITSGIIPSNAYGKLKFEFDFRTDDWDAVETKTANFYYRGANYPIDLDENNQCFVPKPVINHPSFSVSVDGGDITTNVIRISVEEKKDMPTTPDIDDELGYDDVNILDGGEITLYVDDTPPEDNDDNIQEEEDVIDYITKNNIPFYIGLVGDEASEVAYKQLNTSNSDYTDQGFYTTINNSGKVTNAGYQITFDGKTENVAQAFSVCSAAKIVTAYQYQPAFNQWLDMGFDGTFWIESGTMTQTINGQRVTYTTYEYNVDVMGDVITAPEHWRFEVEVS